jgi:MFS family permease
MVYKYNTVSDPGERGSQSSSEDNLLYHEPDPTFAVYSHFSKAQKRGIVFLTAFVSLFSPLSSFIYYPSMTFIANDLRVSIELMNLTITSFMIISGIAPTLLGEMADFIGRRPVYIIMLIVYVCANIALALQHSYPALLLLRMAQSFGSSGEEDIGFTLRIFGN